MDTTSKSLSSISTHGTLTGPTNHLASPLSLRNSPFRPNACPICKRCLTCAEGQSGNDCNCPPQEVKWNRARLQSGFLDFRHKIIAPTKPNGVLLIQWLNAKAGQNVRWGEEINEVNICVRCNSHWMRFKKAANANSVAECVTRLQAKYSGLCGEHPTGCYINGDRHIALDSKLYHQWAQHIVNGQYNATEDYLPELLDASMDSVGSQESSSPAMDLSIGNLKRIDPQTPVQILPKKHKLSHTSVDTNSRTMSPNSDSLTSPTISGESGKVFSPILGSANRSIFGPGSVKTVSVRSERKTYKGRVAVTESTTFESVIRFAIPSSPPNGMKICIWSQDKSVEYMPESLVIETIRGVDHAELIITLEPTQGVDFENF